MCLAFSFKNLGWLIILNPIFCQNLPPIPNSASKRNVEASSQSFRLQAQDRQTLIHWYILQDASPHKIKHKELSNPETDDEKSEVAARWQQERLQVALHDEKKFILILWLLIIYGLVIFYLLLLEAKHHHFLADLRCFFSYANLRPIPFIVLKIMSMFYSVFFILLSISSTILKMFIKPSISWLRLLN